MSSPKPQTPAEFRDRAWRLAPVEYERCTPLEFRVLAAAVKEKTARQLAIDLDLEISGLQKVVYSLTERGLVQVVGQAIGKTRQAYVYKSVDPKTFFDKRKSQINAANPFGLTAAQIAESRALYKLGAA